MRCGRVRGRSLMSDKVIEALGLTAASNKCPSAGSGDCPVGGGDQRRHRPPAPLVRFRCRRLPLPLSHWPSPSPPTPLSLQLGIMVRPLSPGGARAPGSRLVRRPPRRARRRLGRLLTLLSRPPRQTQQQSTGPQEEGRRGPRGGPQGTLFGERAEEASSAAVWSKRGGQTEQKGQSSSSSSSFGGLPPVSARLPPRRALLIGRRARPIATIFVGGRRGEWRSERARRPASSFGGKRRDTRPPLFFCPCRRTGARQPVAPIAAASACPSLRASRERWNWSEST